MYLYKSECASLDEKQKFLVPPSALNPLLTAIASNNVDLPLPFSPTKKLTLLDKANLSKLLTTGNLINIAIFFITFFLETNFFYVYAIIYQSCITSLLHLYLFSNYNHLLNYSIF